MVTVNGINPGVVVVMDENYNVIDNIYYIDEQNKERYIDEFFAVDGMKDNTARTRAVMQCYCKDRGYIDFGD